MVYLTVFYLDEQKWLLSIPNCESLQSGDTITNAVMKAMRGSGYLWLPPGTKITNMTTGAVVFLSDSPTDPPAPPS